MAKVLVIIKPEFLDKTNAVVDFFLEFGYTSTKRIETHLSKQQCEVIWGDIEEKEKNGYFVPGYFDEYCSYIMSGNVECVVLEKEIIDYNEVWDIKRVLRKRYNVEGFRDLLHTSDSNEDAEQEIMCIF